MYYSTPIKQSDKKTWQELIAKNPASGFKQSFEWANFKKLDKWKTYPIGIYSTKTNKLEAGAIIHELILPSKTSFLYIPQGPVLTYENEEKLFWQWRHLEIAIHKLVSHSKSQKTTHIRIEPQIHEVPEWFLSSFVKSPLNLMPKHTQILNITPSLPQILTQMKPKGRYNIRLAERKGVKIKKINRPTPTQIKTFHNIYKQTFNRNKFEGRGLKSFQNLLKSCQKITKLFIAEHQNKALASAFIIYNGNRATYLYGASSNQKRQLMAPYLLHWEIIKDAKADNFTEYDFWGVNASSKDKAHSWHGLSQFKKKFGGEQFNYIGAHDYVIQKDLYEKFLKSHELI